MFAPRRHPLIYVIIVLLLTVTACGGGGSDTALQEAQLAATQVALEATQAALSNPTEAPPTQAPPPTDAPAADQAPTEDSAAEGQTEEAPAFYLEDFDTDSVQLWTYYIFQGNEDNFDIYTENSNLVFEVNEERLYSYFTYDPYTYTDVAIYTGVESLVTRNYVNSLVCRVSSRGWYEALISNNGLYQISKYDAVDNAWINLFDGGSEHIKTGKAINDFGMICQGNSIGVVINGQLERVVEDDYHREGQVGIGVSSFDTYPIIAGFDYVSIEPIQ